MRRWWPVVVVIALAAAGCGGDEPGDDVPATAASTIVSTIAESTIPSTSVAVTTPATSSTTTSSTTTSTSSTAAPTVPATTPPTTAAAGACPAVAPQATGSVESASKSVDVDADGADDTVTTYAVSASPAAGDWHLRVELAAGGGADLVLPDDPAPGQVKLLGGVYIGSDVEPGPQGMRPALFVTTGAGASATIVTLFRLDGCDLVAMGNATFSVGAGVTHAANLRCDGVAGTSVLAYDEIEMVADGATFSVTETGYTRDGNDLAVYGAGPQTSSQSGFPDVSTLIDCPGIDHP